MVITQSRPKLVAKLLVKKKKCVSPFRPPPIELDVHDTDTLKALCSKNCSYIALQQIYPMVLLGY